MNNTDQKLKLNAKELRNSRSSEFGDVQIQKQEIYIIIDNVLDTYNIGSMFRLADAVAAKKIIICGGSETPPNHRIKKASVNTTEWVDWEYCASASEAIKKLRMQNPECRIVAIEQSERSISYDQYDYQLPIALVVGHETDGVSKETLDACDAVVELPMFGVNISLNVMVSLGIVLYQVIEHTSKK